MMPAVVFVRVVSKPEYQHGEQRLLDSYLRFKPKIPHDLVIIDRHGDSPDDVPFAKHLKYSGDGWDCGTWQFAGKNIETDLLVCFNSSTYITCDGWLERFVEAAEAHGDGLYGPLASYEIIPHIRTPCMAFQPKVIQGYPLEVNSRADTYRFEVFGFGDPCSHGYVPNFTQWCRVQGFKTMLVTRDGVYGQPDWRTPPNIFRRGDQSNLMIRDRHCEAYEVSDPAGKLVLEKLADGK